jgi:uncharacterized protein GlcG (DUF336 family)
MVLKLADTNRAIQAAQDKARSLALDVSVAVCDADGRLVAFQRMDGALGEGNHAAIERRWPLSNRVVQVGIGQSKVRIIESARDFRHFGDRAVCQLFAQAR